MEAFLNWILNTANQIEKLGIVGVLVVIILALVAAISWGVLKFFKEREATKEAFTAEREATKKEMQKLRESLAFTNHKVIELTRTIGYLEGKFEVTEQVNSIIENLSKEIEGKVSNLEHKIELQSKALNSISDLIKIKH